MEEDQNLDNYGGFVDRDVYIEVFEKYTSRMKTAAITRNTLDISIIIDVLQNIGLNTLIIAMPGSGKSFYARGGCWIDGDDLIKWPTSFKWYKNRSKEELDKFSKRVLQNIVGICMLGFPVAFSPRSEILMDFDFFGVNVITWIPPFETHRHNLVDRLRHDLQPGPEWVSKIPEKKAELWNISLLKKFIIISQEFDLDGKLRSSVTGLGCRDVGFSKHMFNLDDRVKGSYRPKGKKEGDYFVKEGYVGCNIGVHILVLCMRRDAWDIGLIKENFNKPYSLVGGKVEEGESIVEALKREAKEELSNNHSCVALMKHIEKLGDDTEFLVSSTIDGRNAACFVVLIGCCTYGLESFSLEETEKHKGFRQPLVHHCVSRICNSFFRRQNGIVLLRSYSPAVVNLSPEGT